MDAAGCGTREGTISIAEEKELMDSQDKICTVLSRERMKQISKGTGFQAVLLLSAILIMGNLNAVVDYFLHPEIPYFDHGHVIVGATTAFVSAVLFSILLIHVRSLSKALKTIKTLETFMPICCSCKSVRKTAADPSAQESWQPIETYITENTDSQVSHGICPDCINKLYPDLAAKLF
jgi:hypothetical protein